MIFGFAGAALALRLATASGAPDLAAAAELARTALLRHDAAGVVGESPRLLVQLPGVAPSGPVPRGQAVALLASYLHDYEEVAISLTSIQAPSTTRGIVQLQRSYRVPGTSDLRTQSVLLSYELTGGKWLLAELRISG